MKCLTSGFVVDLAQIRAWKRLGLTNRAGHVGDSRIEAALLLDDVAVLFHLSCSRSASATPAALAARRGCGRGSPGIFQAIALAQIGHELRAISVQGNLRRCCADNFPPTRV